jgi:hypothetical protein
MRNAVSQGERCILKIPHPSPLPKGIGIYTIPELCVKLKSMLFNLTSLAWISVLSSAITAL